jgi:alkylresorcinol/alkylpyrone synthase
VSAAVDGSRSPRVASLGSSLPTPVPQDEVLAFAGRLSPELAEARVVDLFRNTGIDHRHLARPIEWYEHDHAPGERFAIAAEVALEHGVRAGRAALEGAGVAAAEVDSVVFVSTTVLRSPNLDVSLATALGLRGDARRVPVFGLASLGGAAGLGLAADLARAGDRCVLLVCAEMNSMMFVPSAAIHGSNGRADMEVIVSLALFSDGAAAAVVRGDDAGARPRDLTIAGRHTTLVPDSLHVMGFDPTDQGLRWRLAPDVSDVALEWTRRSVEDALRAVGWSFSQIDHALVHPGGSRVLDAVQRALDLPPEALHWSRDVMRMHGNVSSVTVLLVLERFLAEGPPPGRALLTAMGPGFAFEHVLLQTEPGRRAIA